MITESYIKYYGEVIQFDNEKGFGYIKPDSPDIVKPIFLHFSEIMTPSYALKQTAAGQKVNFEIRDFTSEILQAVKVVPAK